jgi:hypothetical protein
MTKSSNNSPKRKTAKPPHNVAKRVPFRSIGELAQAVGAEPRKASIGGQEVVLSQAARLCRLIVEGAINGSASDLKFLIRTMRAHPDIAGSSKERWVLLLAGLDAEL